MNLLSLYHFFAGKASDKQKEAIKRWAESSPDNYETLCREKKIFDAGILLVDKKELSQKENAPLLYKLINYTVKIAAVVDRKSTRLNSSHSGESRMPSSA